MKRTQSEINNDIFQLKKAGFRVVQYSEYHWRAFRKDTRRAVDIWPTSMKCMVAGDSGSQRYRDVVKDVSALFVVDESHKDGIEKLSDFKSNLDKTLREKGL